MPSRPATPEDAEAVTETITLGFQDDPVWSVALARSDGFTAHHRAYWQLFVEGALRYSTVFMAEDASAVSVWIPPEGTELSNDQEAAVQHLIETALEPAAARAMVELWERFNANHPRDEPHAYLSLLATHPDHRGQGIGQRLLAEISRDSMRTACRRTLSRPTLATTTATSEWASGALVASLP